VLFTPIVLACSLTLHIAVSLNCTAHALLPLHLPTPARCLAAAAGGLGMQVVSTDSGSSRQQLEQLLQQSDVVSMHCPLNEATQVRPLHRA
jgi:hypothetical protein